ncbi:MAG: hypothetical protein AB7E79_03255 [Rhodospirillaceae bacterium]
MDKIAQFLERARQCMELTAHGSPEQSEWLVRMAEAWTTFARERRQQLELGQQGFRAANSYLGPPPRAPRTP